MIGINTAIFTARNNLDVSASEPLRNDIFISYSRKDVEFVRTLDIAFRKATRDPWVDWDDIKKGEDWWKAIEAGIEAADTFVFVISPDSISSLVCRNEIDHAVKYNKRMMPIVRREGFDMQQVHPILSSHNWLFFRETDDFETAFRDLVLAIDTDLDHVRAHTRLLVRAIEWESKGQDDSFLLRGNDLTGVEKWLIQGIQKKPKPTKLQADYISASRVVEEAKLKAHQKAARIATVAALLANAVIAATGYFVIHVATDKAISLIRNNMIETVRGAVSEINGDDFATLAKVPVPQGKTVPGDNPLYQKHQKWLSVVHALEPRAYAYTFVRGKNPYEVLWIGDVYRILRPANATLFRESYDASPTNSSNTKLYSGLKEMTVITTPYKDRWGNWISIYAPIRNSAGESVGGIGIDFRANYVINVEQTMLRALLGAYVITFVCLFILGWVILRVTHSLLQSTLRESRLGAAKVKR